MGARRPLLKIFETYPSNQYTGIQSIVSQFLSKHPIQVNYACFGIAGPVAHGRCRVTNLPWEASEGRIRTSLCLKRVQLINDLTATALAIPILKKNELYVLQKGRAQKEGNLALVAPGTGFGESIVVFERGRYIPVPSEGGHIDFAPGNETEVRLWRYLKERYGHVSFERILTGHGLSEIHSFILDSNPVGKYKRILKRLGEGDPAIIISDEAMTGKVKSCKTAMDMFLSILGAAAGNLALTGMATGGVYLGGGIPPKILTKLKDKRFLSSFMDKGRFKGLLEKMPVYVILNDKAALLGAAKRAFEIVNDMELPEI